MGARNRIDHSAIINRRLLFLEVRACDDQSAFGALMPSVIIRGEGVVQASLSEVESNSEWTRRHRA